jgi:sulfocyanin
MQVHVPARAGSVRIPARAAGSRTVFSRLLLLAAGVAGSMVLAVACAPTRGQTALPKTVEFTLVAGKTTVNGSFNFNGYAKGALTITVPVGWKVVIQYANASVLRHSLDVIPYTGTQPDSAPPPSFPGASTKDLVDGIGVGKQETVTFVADRAGTYEFLCGVLGHAQAGMWDYLVVSPTAKAPSVKPSAAFAVKAK